MFAKSTVIIHVLIVLQHCTYRNKFYAMGSGIDQYDCHDTLDFNDIHIL